MSAVRGEIAERLRLRMDKRLDPSATFDGLLGQDVLGRLNYLLVPGAGVIGPRARRAELQFRRQ